MSTTIDTFIYLKRDIEQSFQRVQTISTSSRSNRHELDQLLNHIACTLDDLDKVNRLLCSSSSSTATSENPIVNKSLCDLSDLENECDEEENQLISHPLSSKDHSRENEDLTLSSEERENFIRRMKNQFSYFKGQIPSMKKESQMEIIRLDQVADDDNLNEDQLLRKQDDQLDDMHHSIVSLKNLTKNINSELEDHIRVLDNLGTDMASSQNRVENLTKRTKDFLRTSDGVCGHMCLFSIAVILFFLIIILILFF